ncbi:unnamed protein product [Closterium sp. NIES-53]
MAAQELRWLTYLLTDLGEPPRSPPVLYVDNKAMLALCREHRLEHRTKHIALHYFLARELQQRGQLRLAYVASKANTADIFTKALLPGDHQRFCTMLACFLLLDWFSYLYPTHFASSSIPHCFTVPVRMADPSGGPVLAHSSTVLPCPGVPSGSLSGLHLPSFSTNLVSASGPVAPPCSCHLLSHQTLLWHHRLCHPSLPRLHGMHSRLLVSGLYRSLPPLPPSPALPCVPCVEGQQHAAPHALFPRTTALLQILHMDVWGLARRSKGEVPYVSIPWIRAIRLQLRERFGTDLPVLRLHSDRGGEFSSDLLRDFCRGEGILRSFTLPASPQQNGIAERRIGLVMEVACTSMVHVAAPHFLWPFAVRYAAHQLNLWPRVSLPETSPTLLWTGKVGDASVFWVWGSRAFVRNMSADKLSARAILCIFLGFPPDAPGWQFYHPTSCPVLPSQDVTFDESVPFSRLFPYCTAPLPPPPPPLFLAPGPPPVDPLPPQGAAPLGVSQVDPRPVTVPVEVTVDSGAARGAASRRDASGGAEPAGAEPGGAKSEGAGSGGAEPGGAEPGGAESEGVEPGDAQREHAKLGGAEPGGAELEVVSSGGATGAGGSATGGTRAPGRGVARVTRAAGLGGAHTGGTGAAGVGGAAGFGDGGTGAGAAGGTGAGAAEGTGAAGARGARTGGTGAAGAGGAKGVGVGDPGAGDTGARGAGPGGSWSPVPSTHHMALRPSSVRQHVPLPSPPVSSLAHGPDPESDRVRAASPNVPRLLATVVTDPSFESANTSSLVSELLEFAAACRLDYAASLLAESESDCPSSVGGECALGTDVLEDRQKDLECFSAAIPHLVSMLIAPEGDPDALDIPTPRSYAEAIMGPYSSKWQTAMDAEMASWKSTGTYVDVVSPPGANIVDGMWIFRVKRPLGSPPAFKACYVARGFSQLQGVDFFHNFSLTPKMTTLRVLLHVAAQRDYELHSLDFSTAFFQGSLHEEIWLRRPPCFTWSTTLAALGFAPSTADPSLFLRIDTSLPPFYILVYVNDLVFSTTDTEEPALVKSELQKRHTCTDLGELPNYLGLQITWDRARRTITLTESHMVHQILQRFGFRYSLPQSTPLPTGQSLLAPPSNESYFGHGARAWRIGSNYSTGHADASWVDDLATQWSSQSYTFSLGSSFVSWRSTHSSSILSSSCEAEIYAGAMAAQELRWLTYLLTDLGERPFSSLVLYVDNKAMIALCQEHRLEHRTKHITLRYFVA